MLRARELPRPFLKWPGGKARLADEVLDVLARRPVDTYFEPCVGGAAVFFRGVQRRAWRRAVLGDANPEVVNVYRVVRDDLASLTRHLERRARHAGDEAYFYRVRDADVSTWSPVERAARMLFLNRTCFNGLQRVNRAGRFNAPYGGPRGAVCDVEVLTAASHALQGVEIVQADFAATMARARSRDGIYLDPPYLPTSPSSSFVAYAGAFGLADHLRLVEEVRLCAARGVACVVSSSDTPTARQVLSATVVELRTVRATRSIGASSKSRGRVRELLGVA